MSGTKDTIRRRGLLTTTAAGIAAGVGLLRAPAVLAQTDPGSHGTALFTGQFLTVGQYIVSADQLYYAIVQNDGNFCVYHGSGPSNKGAFVWGSVQAARYQPAPGNYFVIMQSDGNLCGYIGRGPTNQGRFIWGTVQLGGYAPANGKYLAALAIGTGSLGVYKQGSATPIFKT